MIERLGRKAGGALAAGVRRWRGRVEQQAAAPAGHTRIDWAMNRVVWHAAFWAIHVSNEQMIAVVERRTMLNVLAGTITLYTVLAVPAYINLLVLVPRLWRRGHRGGYLAAGLLLAALTAWVFVAAHRASPVLDGDGLRRVLRWTFTCLMFMGSVAAVDTAAHHIRTARERAERDREHAERRLGQLRAQLNPHFLFNTLNSLHALAVTRSPVLPGMILRHADLLRYALDQTRHARVPLAGEVEFLAAYVALERLRISDCADVNLEVEGVVRDQSIAPMIFGPLVENCFKHLGSSAGTAPFIHIHVEITGAEVKFRSRNTRDPDVPDIGRTSGGIGLRNTRERLALLYPGRHRLETRDCHDRFEVELSLIL